MGVGATDILKISYFALLQKKLGKNYIVRNFGASGATVLKMGDSPYVETKEYEDGLNYNADIIILMLGTNDSKTHNWVYGNEFAKDYKDLINSYLNRNRNTQLYIVTSPTVGQEGNFKITDEIVSKEIVELQKSVAVEFGLKVIDVNNATKSLQGIFDDNVQPNDKGYEIIADKIYNSIK